MGPPRPPGTPESLPEVPKGSGTESQRQGHRFLEALPRNIPEDTLPSTRGWLNGLPKTCVRVFTPGHYELLAKITNVRRRSLQER